MKTQNNYQVGQKIKFKSGNEGVVIQVLHRGNGDIRPPYNRAGLPVVKGTSFIGTVTVIHNDWEVMYGDEIKENQVIEISCTDEA